MQTSRRAVKSSIAALLIGLAGCAAPLHDTVRTNPNEALTRIRAGEPINGMSGGANTLLHTAAGHGHTAVVAELIERGADVHKTNDQKDTALLLAADGGHSETVSVLLAAGAHVKATNALGNTPLGSAAWRGHTALAKEFVGLGADLEATNKDQKTPLHRAAWGGHLETLTYLLEAGASVATVDRFRATPLHSAANKNHHEVVKKLIEAGADVNAVDVHGQTALHGATKNLDLIKTLVQSGADVTVRQDKGQSAQDVALALNHPRPNVMYLAAKWPEGTPIPTPPRPPHPPTKAGSLPADAEPVEVTASVSTADVRNARIKKIAVPNMRGAGVETHLLGILSETAVTAMAGRGLTTIGAADIDSMLGFEKTKDLLGCDDVSCMADIGGALGVDALLTLSLGKIGETYTVNASLIQIRGGRPLLRGQGRLRGEPDGLLPLVEEIVRRMVAML